ncbi:hypothetical protein RR46_11580 [Papilio xuthus]|uniref:Uncharacterized protein n=1 Tax=Papilio xuthus TaxID=66420 RepID=A0A194PRD1_PAPXU|nr:hypothetical protein RR46_11580 [Papilio xuthus]
MEMDGDVAVAGCLRHVLNVGKHRVFQTVTGVRSTAAFPCAQNRSAQTPLARRRRAGSAGATSDGLAGKVSRQASLAISCVGGQDPL